MPDASTPSNPRHYCPECATCLESSREECPECDAGRPSGGWTPISESPYPYLGRTIDDRYFVDRFVDSGASGHVYRAKSTRYFQEFALKIIDLRRFDDELRSRLIDRFYREVDTVAQIKNPHVIDVSEALKLNDGVFGLVMNYVDGQTLDVILERHGHLGTAEALSLARQVATGLHEAHRRGIVHRDVKPENIIVEQLPASGHFARILDFGVAVADEGDDDFGFQGTPLYASPEQCTEERPVDARSDIYGLGCMLFHLLVGRPPFPYTNALRVMDAHVDAPRPSVLEVDDEIEIPEPLGHLVDHLLARDPDDRPDSLDTVHRALSELEEGKTPSTLGAPPAYRSRDPAPSPENFNADTPPSDQYASLGERTSSALIEESTGVDYAQLPRWNPDGPVDLTRIDEIDLSDRLDQTDSITATVLDPRGLACLIADASPTLHLVALGGDRFAATFQQEAVVSALAADLHHGTLLAADVGGRIVELDPGSGRAASRHRVTASPMALELKASASRLLVGTERGRVLSMNLRTDSRHDVTRFHQTVSALHSPDRQRLLVGLWDGSVALTDQKRRQWHFPVAPDAIADVGLLDDDRYFAVDARGTLHVGDLAGGEKSASLELGPGIRSTRRTADGRLLALTVFEGRLETWRIEHDF